MEIEITDKHNLHVQLSHTEANVLDKIAAEKGDTVEKVFATLAFGSIMQESAQLKLSKEIAEHDFWWENL